MLYIKYPPYKVFARVLYNYALHGLHGTAARAPLAACCNAPAQTTDADETEAETGSSQIDLFVYDTKQMGQSHGISSDILSRRLRRPIPTAGLTACMALPPRQTQLRHIPRGLCGTHPALQTFSPLTHPPSPHARRSRALMRVGLLVCAGPAKPIPCPLSLLETERVS